MNSHWWQISCTLAYSARSGVDGGWDNQWIAISYTADRDPILTVDKNGQRHVSQMACINKRPATSITTQVTL